MAEEKVLLLKATGISKTYVSGFIRKRRAASLKSVNLEIRKGEIFGLLGPNGAGKTTLLNILMGLIIPDSGEIFIKGKRVRRNFDLRMKRIMNMCSGLPNFPWCLTVYEILRFYAFLYGVDKREAQARIDYLMEKLELERVRNVRFDELSTGNKQRLSLAKSLLNNPELLLLDEPTIGLDPDISVKIRQFIKEMNREHGITIILTTHYMKEAEELCDRIAFIKDGRIIAVGTKDYFQGITEGANLEEAFIALAG